MVPGYSFTALRGCGIFLSKGLISKLKRRRNSPLATKIERDDIGSVPE